MPGHRRRHREERGAAALEFALIVLPLMLIIFGIVNFGVLLSQQMSLTNSARQAARYGVVDGKTCAQIAAEATSNAETMGMPTSAVPTPTITNCASSAATNKPCTGTTSGTNVVVTMVRSGTSNPWVVPFPPFNVIPVPNLTGKGTMRCEFS